MSDDSATRTLMLTFTHPADAASETAFNDWYDHQHIPEIREHVEGVLDVRRYRLSSAPGSESASAPYLAVYEFGSPAGEVLANFGAAAGKLTQSETLGTGKLGPITVLYEQIGTDKS